LIEIFLYTIDIMSHAQISGFIDKFYGDNVSEEERRLDSMKGFALEKALHELRIPMTEDLKQEVFSRLKLKSAMVREAGFRSGYRGNVFFPDPEQIQDELRAVEDDPRFPSFSTSPFLEKGGIFYGADEERFTQPLSKIGRVVYPQVHRQIMGRLADDRYYKNQLAKEFPKSFIEGRNPKS
tara:strand:- start:4067 stop:4609 length:543 start_codon:yes stop_codon:yes gene_type:complete